MNGGSRHDRRTLRGASGQERQERQESVTSWIKSVARALTSALLRLRNRPHIGYGMAVLLDRPARPKRWRENDMTKDEAEIRSIIADHAKAHHAKNVDLLLAHGGEGSSTLAPLQNKGGSPKEARRGSKPGLHLGARSAWKRAIWW